MLVSLVLSMVEVLLTHVENSYKPKKLNEVFRRFLQSRDEHSKIGMEAEE